VFLLVASTKRVEALKSTTLQEDQVAILLLSSL
jgi:hypothetical protein